MIGLTVPNQKETGSSGDAAIAFDTRRSHGSGITLGTRWADETGDSLRTGGAGSSVEAGRTEFALLSFQSFQTL